MSQLVEKLGGIDKIANSDTTVISIVGGFNKKLNPMSQNYVVGNITKDFVKNKITEWETFKYVYYENGKLKPKYYDKLMDVMNNIFTIPIYTESDKELIYMITTMYNSSDEEFFNGINKSLNLLKPFKLTLRHLFMSWKLFLEKLIEIFVLLRNSYIEKQNQKEPKNKENDFTELVEKWVEIDMENRTDTSSPILFFNFPPKKVNLEKSIPKIEWQINGAPKNITDVIDTFLKAIKQNEFGYCGFCIHAVIERFKLLMDFPFAELLNIIYALYSNQDADIKQKLKIITKNIKSLSPQICNIKNMKSIKINKPKVPLSKYFPKNPENKIQFYEKYIEAYLNIYQQILPNFVKKEKLICQLSLKINVISNDIMETINILDKNILKNKI